MADISNTLIANMALSHIGAAQIDSLTEASSEARQVTIWYDYSRLQALEVFDWNFARKRLQLALHGDVISDTSTDPLAGVWGFRYQYPGDCVAARKIQNSAAPPDDATPFEVEVSLDGQEKTILSDMEDAVLVYTFDTEHTNLYSPFFVELLSHLLASHIAFSLTGKNKVKENEFAIYQSLVISAPAHNANEMVEAPPRDSEWIRGRA